MEDYLKMIYFNQAHPTAFAGPEKLHQVVKNEGLYNISRSKLKQWLQDQDSYSLHKPVRYKFKRKRIVPTGRDSQWDMDLADVSNIAKYNNGIRYLLIAIDTFSRKLWVRPLTDKNHKTVLPALEGIIHERKPVAIRSDKGSEFKNRWMKTFMEENNIYHYFTQNETKANYAERVIRTLKNMMYRYFTHNQTYKYSDQLQKFVEAYNNQPHRSLRNRTPNSIGPTESVMWKQLYVDPLKKKLYKNKPYKFKVGDYVRLSQLKYPFQTDYQEKWTEEIFKIRQRERSNYIPIYKIKDWAGEEISGTFYESELQKVNKDNNHMWRIENIMKRRVRNGRREVLIKWQGWPKKFNSWEEDNQIMDL